MANAGSFKPGWAGGPGRPKGSKTQKTAEIALEAAVKGISPVEVMLEAMRSHYAAGRLDEAAEIAAKVAPYTSPRLAAVAHYDANPRQEEEPVRAVVCTTYEEAAALLPLLPEAGTIPPGD